MRKTSGMPNWETMPLQFYTGVGLVVGLIIVSIVTLVLLRRFGRTTSHRPLSAADQKDIQAAQRLYDTAVASEMAAIASAQRQ